MRTPTWGSIVRFCKEDGWRPDRQTKHVFFQKVLEDGTTLETHVSRGLEDNIGEGLFKFILRTQLKVSASEFWAVIDERRPAQRPAQVPERPAVRRPTPSLVRQLERELRLGSDELANLSYDDAVRLLIEHRSRPR